MSAGKQRHEHPQVKSESPQVSPRGLRLGSRGSGGSWSVGTPRQQARSKEEPQRIPQGIAQHATNPAHATHAAHASACDEHMLARLVAHSLEEALEPIHTAIRKQEREAERTRTAMAQQQQELQSQQRRVLQLLDDGRLDQQRIVEELKAVSFKSSHLAAGIAAAKDASDGLESSLGLLCDRFGCVLATMRQSGTKLCTGGVAAAKRTVAQHASHSSSASPPLISSTEITGTKHALDRNGSSRGEARRHQHVMATPNTSVGGMEDGIDMGHGVDMQTCLQHAIHMPHGMIPSPDAPWSLSASESVNENDAQACKSVNWNHPSESVSENHAIQGGLEHGAHASQAPPSPGAEMQGSKGIFL